MLDSRQTLVIRPRIKPKATAIAVISIVTAAPVSSKGKESIIRLKSNDIKNTPIPQQYA